MARSAPAERSCTTNSVFKNADVEKLYNAPMLVIRGMFVNTLPKETNEADMPKKAVSMYSFIATGLNIFLRKKVR